MIDTLQNPLSASWLYLLNAQPLIRQSTERVCLWKRSNTHPNHCRVPRPAGLSGEVWVAAEDWVPGTCPACGLTLQRTRLRTHPDNMPAPSPIKEFLWSCHKARGFYMAYSTLSSQFIGFQWVTLIAKWCVWNSFNKTKPLLPPPPPSEIRAERHWLLCWKEVITCSQLQDIENSKTNSGEGVTWVQAFTSCNLRRNADEHTALRAPCLAPLLPVNLLDKHWHKPLHFPFQHQAYFPPLGNCWFSC